MIKKQFYQLTHAQITLAHPSYVLNFCSVLLYRFAQTCMTKLIKRKKKKEIESTTSNWTHFLLVLTCTHMWDRHIYSKWAKKHIIFNIYSWLYHSWIEKTKRWCWRILFIILSTNTLKTTLNDWITKNWTSIWRMVCILFFSIVIVNIFFCLGS
jgi:hypothetical protein